MYHCVVWLCVYTKCGVFDCFCNTFIKRRQPITTDNEHSIQHANPPTQQKVYYIEEDGEREPLIKIVDYRLSLITCNIQVLFLNYTKNVLVDCFIISFCFDYILFLHANNGVCMHACTVCYWCFL